MCVVSLTSDLTGDILFGLHQGPGAPGALGSIEISFGSRCNFPRGSCSPPPFSSLGLNGGWLSVISGLKELFLGEFSTLFLMFDYPEAVRVSCSK